MTKTLTMSGFIASAILLTYPSVSAAQAWTKAENSGFYKLDFTRVASSRVFDTHGEVLPFRPTRNNTLSVYGEYGITNKLTLIGYVPFLVANRFDASKTTTGVDLPAVNETSFGDVDVSFRYQLYNKKGLSVSANVLLGLPTGNSKQENGLLTGDGEFNQMVKIAAGTGKAKWWTQGAVGFNNRTNDFSDEFRYDFEFGYKFFNDRLLAIFKINGIESLDNGTAKENGVGLYANNVEFGGFGPEILYYVSKKKNIGVSFRLGRSFKGRNVLGGPSFSVGAFAQF
jgi:protein XagA